jgi:hypothetical protein
VGHALRAGLAAEAECVTLQIDWKNAFSTVRRDRMLSAVAERCPTLLPMVEWAYGRHTRLHVQQTDQVMNSESGVRHGDPLGMLLFACRHYRDTTGTHGGGGKHEPGQARGVRPRHLPPGCPCWTKIAGSCSTAAFNAVWHTCLGTASGSRSAEPSSGRNSERLTPPLPSWAWLERRAPQLSR